MEQKQLEEMSIKKQHLFFYDEPLLISNENESADNQKVQRDLRVVDHVFFNAPSVSPAVGFSARWQARLVQFDVKKQRQQTITFLMVLIGATSLVSFLFFGQLVSELRLLPGLMLDRILNVSAAFGMVTSAVMDISMHLSSIAGMMLAFWFLFGGVCGTGLFLLMSRRRPRMWLGL